MKGNNTMRINEATLIDALSEYFESFLDEEEMEIASLEVIVGDTGGFNLELKLMESV